MHTAYLDRLMREEPQREETDSSARVRRPGTSPDVTHGWCRCQDGQALAPRVWGALRSRRSVRRDIDYLCT